MYGRLIVILTLGRLLVWLLQTSGLTKRIWQRHPILTELGECDLCLGCWVFTALAWTMKMNVFDPFYSAGISEVATGCALAFVVHLVRIGWQTRFGTLDLDG